MPVVICNTSPIQYLYQTDMLELLPALAGQVYVPEAVVAELEEGRRQECTSTCAGRSFVADRATSA